MPAWMLVRTHPRRHLPFNTDMAKFCIFTEFNARGNPLCPNCRADSVFAHSWCLLFLIAAIDIDAVDGDYVCTKCLWRGNPETHLTKNTLEGGTSFE